MLAMTGKNPEQLLDAQTTLVRFITESLRDKDPSQLASALPTLELGPIT